MSISTTLSITSPIHFTRYSQKTHTSVIWTLIYVPLSFKQRYYTCILLVLIKWWEYCWNETWKERMRKELQKQASFEHKVEKPYVYITWECGLLPLILWYSIVLREVLEEALEPWDKESCGVADWDDLPLKTTPVVLPFPPFSWFSSRLRSFCISLIISFHRLVEHNFNIQYYIYN